MHGLFFDVRPKPGHMPHYFDHVDRLKPELAEHTGLLELERFRPLDTPDALLSHQIWQSDGDIAGWRRNATHRASQSAGKAVHFEGYRIRVGPMLWQGPGAVLPSLGAGRYLVASYADAPGETGRAYQSITTEGRFLTLQTAQDEEGVGAIVSTTQTAQHLRLFEIARDYSMTERAEAPQ